MTMWPETMTVGPLREWPGVQTPASMRVNSSFRAPLSSTLELLGREIWHLAKTQAHLNSAEMLVAIPANLFRKDGRPYATAKADHPGIVFSMDSPHGHLSYPSDRFLTWEENLRAVALSLEALRKVNRYGVTRRGEQYRGFQAIEAVANTTTTVEHAFVILDDIRGFRISRDHPAEIGMVLRYAKRVTHPDTGAQNEFGHTFQDVTDAERVLREAGLL